SAAIAIAGSRDTVERLENARQLGRRHAGPLILHGNMGAPVLVAELDTHGRADGREANSVAQYVLDRAAQQTLIAIDHDARAWYRIHTFVRGAGLDARILHDLAHEYRQVDRLSCQHRLGSSQLRQLQHLADQRIETLGFQLDAIELASNCLS